MRDLFATKREEATAVNRYKWEHLVRDPGNPTVNAHCEHCYGFLRLYFSERTETWAWWCTECGHIYHALEDIVVCELCLQQAGTMGGWL